MNELKKLLENAGMGEGVMDYLTKGRAAPDIEPTDTVWTPEGTGTVVDGYQGRSGHYTSFDVEMLRSGEIKRFNIRDLKPMKPNVGVKEDVDDDLRYAEKYGDEDLDWGDELIEDLKLLLSEVENNEISDELYRGLIDLISQYDRSDD